MDTVLSKFCRIFRLRPSYGDAAESQHDVYKLKYQALYKHHRALDRRFEFEPPGKTIYVCVSYEKQISSIA